MARKSNKTAHVLNLIAGHDAAKDTTEATDNTESPNANVSSETEKTADAAQTAASAAAQGISVIDTPSLIPHLMSCLSAGGELYKFLLPTVLLFI